MSKRTIKILALVLVITMILTTSFACAQTSVSRYTGGTYTHNNAYDDHILVNGIDVSAYQANINWAKVKADGIDYAIIRVAGRGYGASGILYKDSCFESHIQGAKAAGLMVGIYFFSQAITELEAVAEAEYAVELLGDYDIDLPIYMDYEFAGSPGRLTSAGLSKIKATNNVKAFCNRIQELGYKGGVYANLNFLTNTIDGKALSDIYPVWAAQYNSKCQYGYKYDIWQYTSSGSISGISSRMDTNFMYLSEETPATSADSISDCQVSFAGNPSFTYDNGASYEPVVVVYNRWGMPLTQGVDYKVKYVNNTQEGTGYAVVMGMGLYTDYKTAGFPIAPNTSTAGITIGNISPITYSGSENKPAGITVTEANGNVLTKGVDYTWTASNTSNVGTARVNVTFMGNYSGTKSASYSIIKGTQTITVSNAKSNVGENQEPFNLGVTLKFPDGGVSYSSSNKNVATVSSTGKVTITGGGTTTIKITAAGTSNYEGATKSFDLTVTKPVQNVTATYTSFDKEVSDGEFNLVGVKTDGNGKITYESSDKSVVTVNASGQVSIVGPGTATITVKASETDAYKAGILEITVRVAKGYQTVTSTYTMYTRNELDGMFSLNGKTDGDGSILYSSSDEAVASVSTAGKVTVMGPGTAIITITALETDKYYEGSKQVTVTVNALTEEEKAEKAASIKAGVERTKVVLLKATPYSKKVKLTWKKTSGYAVDYYQVWRSTKKSSGYKKIFTSSNATSKYYINTKDIKSSTTYWYKVRGVRNVAGKLVYTPFTKISTKTLK